MLPTAISHSQVSPAGPSIFGSGPLGSASLPSLQERARRKLLAVQKTRHHKEMTADVSRLLELASELKEEAEHRTGSLEGDAEKAHEIEKLAHRVQTLMREPGDG